VYTQFYLIRLFTAIGFVVADLYFLALWCFAFMRTGFNFAWVFAICSGAALFVDIINVALAFDFPGVKRFLGPDGYYVLYWVFLAVQPCVLLLNIIGATILVRFLLRSDSLSASRAKV
jgi:hypothetical protein